MKRAGLKYWSHTNCTINFEHAVIPVPFLISFISPFFCILQPEKHELMKSLLLYRILSYALLLVAAFLCLMLLAVLPTALANPVLLLFVFLIACVIIYSYTSFRFLQRGIDGRQRCKTQLRDLMKVNSYFSVGIAVLFIMQSITLLGNPQLADDAATQALDNMPPEANFGKEDILKTLRFIERFFLIYGIVLLTHIFFTYRYLKMFREVFEEKKEDAE